MSDPLRLGFLLVALATAACSEAAVEQQPAEPSAPRLPDGRRLTILHTNDWQSHLLGYGPNSEYTPASTHDDGTVGGIARMKSFVDEVRRTTDHPVVLYDSGDWMAGTLFQMLRTSHAPELQMMHELGFDAVTLGNHEFDWGADELARIIARADASTTGGARVPILATNTQPNPDAPGDDEFEALFENGRIERVRVDTLADGLRVGLFGLIGDTAGSITPGIAPGEFRPAIDSAREAVATLRGQGVDIVVALTHAGWREDMVLAREVEGIDVIVGSHDHLALFEPKRVGDTLILQAGGHTQYVGRLELVSAKGAWVVDSYRLHELDDTRLGDAGVQAQIDVWIDALDQGPLRALGMRSFGQAVLKASRDLRIPTHTGGEHGLADLVTDAYRDQASEALAGSGAPIDVAWEAQGFLREDLRVGATGVLGFSDVFRVLSLGSHPTDCTRAAAGDDVDERPGYPLVDVWLTGRELALGCEFTSSLGPSNGPDFIIRASGMRCAVDMSRPMFRRTVEAQIEAEGAWLPIDRDALYHVTMQAQLARLLPLFNLAPAGEAEARIRPRDDSGNILERPDCALVVDPEQGRALLSWEALIGYVEKLDPDGTPPSIPARYLDDRLLGY